MPISAAAAAVFPLSLSQHKLRGSPGFALFSTPKSADARSVRRKSPSLRCAIQNLADLAPAAAVSYGVLLLGGGLFAFARSGSRGSLLGGLSGSALMAASYFLMQSPDSKPAGEALGFGAAFLFSAVFGIRLGATQKLVPSGVLLVLSIATMAFLCSAYLQDKI